MKASLLHASRGRPEMATNAFVEWWSKCCRDMELEYVLSIEPGERIAYLTLIAHGSRVLGESFKVICHKNVGFPEATNRAAKAATGDLLIVIADDLGCPVDWDRELAAVINGCLADPKDTSTPYVIFVSDGMVHDGCGTFCAGCNQTHPIMSRAYYERMGKIFHPGYRVAYADVEWTKLANREATILPAEHLTFEHRHPSVGKGKWDAHYRARRMPELHDADHELYRKREKEGFRY